MMKFFRKHNRKLLAVFMAGLLVMWLGGTALEGLFAPSKSDRLVGESRVGLIELQDQQQGDFETKLLQAMGFNWQNPWPVATTVRAEPLGIIDWILLTREARQYGIRVRGVEVDDFLNAWGISPADLRTLAGRRDVKVQSLRSAAADLIAVRRLAGMIAKSALKSEAEIRRAVRDRVEKVRVNLVTLMAKNLSDAEETFSDEEIGVHFEKYRTVPHKGARGLSFGYFQPAQVKVEYIMVEVDKIAPNLRIGEKTLESKAKGFWRQNRADPKFRRPPDALLEPELGEEIGDPPSPYFETFDEAREVALTEVRRQFARDEAEKIAEWLVGQLVEPWYDQSEGPDGYKEAPDGVLGADYFDTVLQRLPKKWQYGDAVRVEMTDFIRDGEVYRAQPVGRCVVRMPGGQSRAFADLAFLVQGIAPMPTDSSVDTSFYLAKGQTGPMPLSGLNQNQIVYRIVEVKPPAEPASAGEVRDQVNEDLRLLHAYQRATEAAELLAAAAASDGLKAAFDAAEGLQPNRRGAYFSPRPFTRRITTSLRPDQSSIQVVAGVGVVDETFVEKCLALAENPEGQRIGVIPVETLPAAVVVEWVETIRLGADEYTAQRERIGAQLNSTAMSRAVGEWLAPDRVRLRNNFTFAQR